jgi:hypothetical protein
MLISMVYANEMLPQGYADARWGITPQELAEQVELHKATPGSEYNYSDHMETDPEVYIQLSEENKRIEYYFFKSKLYKVYIVYDKSLTSDEFYQQKIDETKAKYGEAKDRFDENYFGLPVKHIYWEDERSVLDLRLGAGFVYKVLIDKKTAHAKKILQQLKHAI